MLEENPGRHPGFPGPRPGLPRADTAPGTPRGDTARARRADGYEPCVQLTPARGLSRVTVHAHTRRRAMPQDFVYETAITVDHEAGTCRVDTTVRGVASALLRAGGRRPPEPPLPALRGPGRPAPLPQAEGAAEGGRRGGQDRRQTRPHGIPDGLESPQAAPARGECRVGPPFARVQAVGPTGGRRKVEMAAPT